MAGAQLLIQNIGGVVVVGFSASAILDGPTIEATGRQEPNNLFDAPVEMTVRYKFAEPAFEMIWEQPTDGVLSIDFVGSEATLSGFWKFEVTKGEADLSPTRPDEHHLRVSDNHSSNWLECIATRRRPCMDVEIGHRVTTWSHLGNIAYELGRKLQWDPVTERFPNDEEANRMLHVAYREPWRI